MRHPDGVMPPAEDPGTAKDLGTGKGEASTILESRPTGGPWPLRTSLTDPFQAQPPGRGDTGSDRHR